MKIAQVYWFDAGPPNTRVDSAMLSSDGETIGALANGHVYLIRRDGTRVSLPGAVTGYSYKRAALSSNGNCLALANGCHLRLVHLSSGKICSSITTEINAMCWHPQGKSLAIGHEETHASLWSSEGEHLQQVTLPGARRRHRWWEVAFSEQGDQVFVTSTSYPSASKLCALSMQEVVASLDLPEGRRVHGLVGWREAVWLVLSDHVGTFELTAYASDLRLVERLRLPTDATVLAAIPESNWLAAGTVDGEVQLLSLAPFRILARRALFSAPVRTLVSASEGYLLAGANDGKLALIEVWD